MCVWTQQGTKLLDGFAGLAVVNVGHGRREIAEAIAEQTVRLAYYPTTRQFSNRPAAELAARLAALTPGDLTYSMFAVSGSEASAAEELLEYVGMRAFRDQKASALSYGQQKLVELAQVLMLATEFKADVRAIVIVQSVRVLILGVGLPGSLSLLGFESLPIERASTA